MWLNPARYEIVDPQMVEILRAKSIEQKLAIADGMWRMARELILSSLRMDHPDWSAEQLAREAARRLSHGAV